MEGPPDLELGHAATKWQCCINHGPYTDSSFLKPHVLVWVHTPHWFPG